MILAFALPLLGLLTYAAMNGAAGYCCGWVSGCGKDTSCTNKFNSDGTFVASMKTYSISHAGCVSSTDPNAVCTDDPGTALCYQPDIFAGPNCTDFQFSQQSFGSGCVRRSTLCFYAEGS